MTHDVLVRGGTVVDGTGSPAMTADVALRDGRIVEVGRIDGHARRTIDADGLLVTPGFVDVHTHYDGQVTWDSTMAPSCWHGVTTVVMGNCGVGFAPCRPERRDWLVSLMEAVEEIPGTALHEGMTWKWETFPEYLDHLSGLRRTVDFGTQIAHGPLRAYVMDDRGARNHRATADDVAAMATLTRQAIEAGALGFTMSRTYSHKTADGGYVPGTLAEPEEILGIAGVLGELGRGVIEVTPLGVVGEDLEAPQREMAWMRQLATETGRPVTFALVQHPADPEAWRVMLELARRARAEGLRIVPQVHGRAPMVLTGLDTVTNPFARTDAWQELRRLGRRDRAHRLRTDTELRRRLVDELRNHRGARLERALEEMYPLGTPPDYEPSTSQSLAALGRRTGRHGFEVMLDVMAAGDGLDLVNRPFFNYVGGSLDAVRQMLDDPGVVVGLGDAGAHCASTCDASLPTWMLSHWVRDRSHDRLPLARVVQMLTSDTARLYGLLDRGVVAPGMKADLNLIDFERLAVERPALVSDLPTGAARFDQRARGYVASLVSGDVTFEDGEPTGALPGRLLRGPQTSPA